MPQTKADSSTPDALKVIVTCDDAFVHDGAARKQVLVELKAKGLTEAKVMDKIGIVTGRIRADQMTTLASVRHVIGVEREQSRSAI